MVGYLENDSSRHHCDNAGSGKAVLVLRGLATMLIVSCAFWISKLDSNNNNLILISNLDAIAARCLCGRQLRWPQRSASERGVRSSPTSTRARPLSRSRRSVLAACRTRPAFLQTVIPFISSTLLLLLLLSCLCIDSKGHTSYSRRFRQPGPQQLGDVISLASLSAALLTSVSKHSSRCWTFEPK